MYVETEDFLRWVVIACSHSQTCWADRQIELLGSQAEQQVQISILQTEETDLHSHENRKQRSEKRKQPDELGATKRERYLFFFFFKINIS